MAAGVGSDPHFEIRIVSTEPEVVLDLHIMRQTVAFTGIGIMPIAQLIARERHLDGTRLTSRNEHFLEVLQFFQGTRQRAVFLMRIELRHLVGVHTSGIGDVTRYGIAPRAFLDWLYMRLAVGEGGVTQTVAEGKERFGSRLQPAG